MLQKSSKRDEVTAVAVEKDSTFWEMGRPEVCVVRAGRGASLLNKVEKLTDVEN